MKTKFYLKIGRMVNRIELVTPKLRFDGFEEKFEYVNLNVISSFKKGIGLSKKDIINNAQFECILYGELFTKYNFHINVVLSKTNSMQKIKSTNNDVLVPASSTSIDYLFPFVSIAKSDVILGSDINIFTINEKYLNKYIALLFSKSKNNKRIYRYSEGSTINHLYGSDILTHMFYITTQFNEQTKIAKFFTLLDKQIQLIERKLELYELRKKYYLNKMFCNNDSNVFNIRINGYDEKNENYKIKDMYEIYSGLSGLDSKNFIGGKDQYISYSSVFNNIIIEEKELKNVNLMGKKQNIVIKNDILVTATSETPKEIGFNSIYLGEQNVYLNSFCFGMRSIINVNNIYINYLLKSKKYRIKIIGFGQGSTRYNMSKNGFKEMMISIPKSIEEQTKIANFFSLLDKNIENTKNKKDQLTKRKTYYLNNMFV